MTSPVRDFMKWPFVAPWGRPRRRRPVRRFED